MCDFSEHKRLIGQAHDAYMKVARERDRYWWALQYIRKVSLSSDFAYREANAALENERYTPGNNYAYAKKKAAPPPKAEEE